jgi:2-succinyl-5-enolpyruvyl-6-hydroxy-3-cyclohexene-1-carboxylate synthase
MWSDVGAMTAAAPRPEDVQATFCATLVDEWARAGVVDAVIAPGSRSTPMALALVGDGRLRVHVHQDERSAAFLALGRSLVTGEPTVVLTTSGTAAVELHPAVVEADLAGVPLLVCTADRPAELIDVGAPQAIDQTHLFGRSPRWAHSPGVADPAGAPRWRPLAARAYAEATGPRPGPVHLNLAFREPLLGAVGELPPAREGSPGPWAWRSSSGGPEDPVIDPREDLQGRRGVVLAGPGSGDGEAVAALAGALGWPVLAAPQAAVWRLPGATVVGADALLRDAGVAEALRPEVVLHLGLPLASRVVGEWAAGSGATHLAAAGPGRWVDPHGVAAVVLDDGVDGLLATWAARLQGIEPVDGGAWRRRWHGASEAAEAAIAEVLEGEAAITEPGAAASLVEALPSGSRLVVSSSMPIRDLEWYVAGGRDVEVLANRGANGIDGVVSTAIGAALAGEPTALLIGDLAFLHDSNGLLGATARGIDLVVVVVDNDGGGIFSFLPQSATLAAPEFEQLFGTPHGLDLAAVASAYGISATVVRDDLASHLQAALAAGGVQVLVVRTDRTANRALHGRLNEAVAAAVRPVVG